MLLARAPSVCCKGEYHRLGRPSRQPFSCLSLPRQEFSAPWESNGRYPADVKVPHHDTPWNMDDWRLEEARKYAAMDEATFSEQLHELLTSLPGIDTKHPHMYPRIIAQLVQGSPMIASRLIELKLLLPTVDVADLVTHNPWLVRSMDWQDTICHVRQLVADYGTDTVSEWVVSEPDMFDPMWESKSGRSYASKLLPGNPATDAAFGP